MPNYFFHNFPENTENKNITDFIIKLEQLSNDYCKQMYLLTRPLLQKTDFSNYEYGCFLVTSNMKLLFINFNDATQENFEEYVEVMIDELFYLVKKHEYIKALGRTNKWNDYYCKLKYSEIKNTDINDIINNYSFNLHDPQEQELLRKCKILVSLAIGSINDVNDIGVEVPDCLIDEIKHQIKLLDTTQTDFIYRTQKNKRITIQGLAGTGKTELLIRKLIELYENDNNYRIVMTCHNKVLANSLKKRIPDFFNFMKVETQIKWGENLFVFHSWGSSNNTSNQGMYGIICQKYDLTFYTLSDCDFSTACERALDQLENMGNIEPIFDYVFIDEGQDFSESFFELCEKVTKKTVYIGEDIFQDIFSVKNNNSNHFDYLLNKCYRTDPRTLMFAHGFSMGLFFKEKKQWLSDDNWNKCGYSFERNNEKFIVTREPIERFEELSKYDYKCIDIFSYENKSISDNVIEIITDIKDKNPSVEPNDIAIIFIEDIYNSMKCINQIENELFTHFDWSVNRAFVTKQNLEGNVFLSNINNVKGLEFSFVIIIANSYMGKKRLNSIYTALTRSFISSYLIINEDCVQNILQSKIDDIIKTNKLEINEPSEEEKKVIEQNIYLDDFVNFEKVHDSVLFNMVDEYVEFAKEILDDLIPKYKVIIFTKPSSIPENEIIKNCKSKILSSINSRRIEAELTMEDLYEL